MRRVAALAALLVLAGCGQNKDEGISGGGKVIGSTVTVYSLAPDPGGAGLDFVDGEKLALSDSGGRAGDYSVNFTSLDLGRDGDTAAQAESARRAINDPAIIAAIVPANDVTVPLFNAAGILQVAPGDAAAARDPNLLPSGRETVFGPEGRTPPDFDARFRKAFNRAPGADAERGYRAMAGVIAAIAKAGAAGNDRSRVIASY